MAIQFIVEDGSGKNNATSYASEEEFRQYWENRGTDFSAGGTPGATDVEIQVWLNIATSYLDTNYRYFGAKTTPDVQALEFPRTNLRDRNGDIIDNTTLPDDIKNACIELAKVVKDSPDLYADDSDKIESQSLGPASVSYKKGVQLTLYKSTVMYLKPYLMGGTLLVNRV